MKFEKRAIALCATVLGVSLAIPSWGTAAMNGNSRQSPTRYAENSDMGSPRNVDDATLKRAAAAYVKVTDISAKTQQAMNSTDDATKKQQLAADSESAKLAAVKAEGMEPRQYNNVIQLVKADNTLQQKFLSYVQELKHSL